MNYATPHPVPYMSNRLVRSADSRDAVANFRPPIWVLFVNVGRGFGS